MTNKSSKSKDVDFVTVGSGIELAQAVQKRLKNSSLSIFKNFGTAQIKTADWEFEFVGARKESYTLESRNPKVSIGSLNDDQNRRDFTINSMALSLNKHNFGSLLDPFNGIQDLENKPTLSSSQKGLDLELLTDQKIDKDLYLDATQKKPQWIDFTYDKPFTLNTLNISLYQPPRKKGTIHLMTSEDGINYKKVRQIKPMPIVKYERAVELAFNGVKSRFFRIVSEVPLQPTEITLSNLKQINKTLARTSLFKIENHKMPKIKTKIVYNVF